MSESQQKFITKVRRSRSAFSAGPLLIALSLALVVAGGWYTDVRRPLPDPLQPVAGLQWWFTPVERNAFMRLPVVTGDLYAVDASDDGQVLWAVGEKTLIVGTTDGGRTWRRGKVLLAGADSNAGDNESTPAAAEPKPAAAAFNIIDALNPVAAAHAIDDPKQYENPPVSNAPAYDPKVQRKIPDVAQESPAASDVPTAQDRLLNSTLRGVAIIDAQRAIAVGENGVVLLTQDGGETWSQQELQATRNLLSYSANLLSVAFSNDSEGIAVGERGTVLRTEDGGITWAYEPLKSSGTLWSVAAADAQNWVIVGQDGLIVNSTDGGRSWEFQSSPSDSTFVSVAFADALNGVACSSSQILTSNDGGKTWAIDAGFKRPRQNQMEGAGISGGRIVAIDSEWLLYTDDGSWSQQAVKAGGNRPLGLEFAANGSVFVVGERGLLTQSSDFGRTWKPLTAYAGIFQSVFAHQNLAVILGYHNLVANMDPEGILGSSDGGLTWTANLELVTGRANSQNGGDTELAATVPTVTPVVDIAFTAPDRAIAVAQGRVLVSKDAGKTFEPVLYKHYPSPWLWVACALLLASAALLLRRSLRKPEVDQQPSSITDAAASDRPIEWGDPDPAGLRDIALGLSRFLRNRRTEPPLTIAVTGEWGTGKSSLMNLLRHDLMRYGYKPVWFNAWHHQSGENLLGSLLANIHAQGVPSLHTVSGLDFRLTLLAIRSRRFWWRLTLTLFLITVVVFSYQTLGTSASKLWGALTNGEIAGGITNLEAATGLLGILVAVLTPILGAVRAVSAFGLQPAKLIAAVATTKHDESARVEAGARYRFAREFADFTRALDPRPLVIFIDDLDRCRAENVIEVLEAVNFLISSGRCIVVIGMARRWVETCVGLAFKELAQAHIEERDADESATTDASTEQQMFARHYLEKLINVEIRVPRLSDSAASAILQGDAAAAPSSGVRYGLGTALLRTGTALVLIAIVVGVVALGKSTAGWLKDLDSTLSQRQVTASKADGLESRPPAQPRDREVPVRPDDDRPVIFDAPQAQTSMSWYFGTGASVALALFAFVVVAMFARKESRTDDSPAFREALSLLQPWIMVGGSSPRSLKRFINHVRYIAMRFRPAADIATTYENYANRMRQWFGRAPIDAGNSGVPQRLQLSEELLVALATLHRCNEGWLDELFIARERDLDLLLIRDIGPQIKDPDERQSVLRRLRESIAGFNERFKDSQLFENEMLDRRHAIAFYEVMAFETGVREPAPSEDAAVPTPLRSA